jgi:hypothetical protein
MDLLKRRKLRLPCLRRPGELVAMRTRSLSLRIWRLVNLGPIQRLMRIGGGGGAAVSGRCA